MGTGELGPALAPLLECAGLVSVLVSVLDGLLNACGLSLIARVLLARPAR